MKSVGEIMSIGRSFEEIIQKGLRMIGQGMHGFVGNDDTKFRRPGSGTVSSRQTCVSSPSPQALEEGYTIERIHELTKIDPWFLGKLKNIVDYKQTFAYNKVEDIPADVLRQAKVLGFSDFQIARFVLNPSGNMEKENLMYAPVVRSWVSFRL